MDCRNLSREEKRTIQKIALVILYHDIKKTIRLVFITAKIFLGVIYRINTKKYLQNWKNISNQIKI